MKNTLLPLLVLLLSISLLQAQFPYTYPVQILPGLQGGSISVSHSPLDIGSIGDAFDGDANSLARSANVNPLIVTLTFDRPIHLSGSSILCGYGDGWWTLECANSLADLNSHTGSYQELLYQAPISSDVSDSLGLNTDCRLLRLSLRRTTGDDYVHLREWSVQASATVLLTELCLLPAQQRLLPGTSFRPEVWGLDSTGQRYPLPSGAVVWTSNHASVDVSPGGLLTAGSGTGGALITADFQGLTVESWVKVVDDFVPPTAPSRLVRVALVVIDPPTPIYGGLRFHERFGWDDPLALTQALLDSLTAASAGAVQYALSAVYDDTLLYTTFEDFPLSVDSLAKLFLEPGWTTLHYVAEQIGQAAFDYNGLLAAHDFCAASDSGLLDEVWVYSMPFLGAYESRLTGQGAFWYNSPPLTGNDCVGQLPIMGLNYERGVAEAWHSYGHRVESAMAQLFGRWNAQAEPQNAWEQYSSLQKDLPGRAQVGNIHFPPNGESDYDYGNPASVLTYAPQWKRYPFLLGDSAVVTCAPWACDHLAFMSWWHRHLPHFVCKDQNGFLNNWWAYIVDFSEGKLQEQTIADCDCLFFSDNVADHSSDPSISTSPTLNLQPNPANGETWVSAAGVLSDVLIFNVLGKKIKHMTATPSNAGMAWPLDLSGLPAGLYFLQGRMADGGVATGRLEVLR